METKNSLISEDHESPREEEKEVEEKETNNISLEQLNKYHKLKQQYFSNRHNRKCVNCNRNVKTIFLTRYNEENKSRVLTATCGDSENPCNLNIEIILNPVELLDNIVNKEKEKLAAYQLQIIKTKNDLLFGYITQDAAIEIFENIKISIKDTTVKLEAYLIRLLNVTHNSKNQSGLSTNQAELYKHIQDLKTHIKMFKSTDEFIHILEAVEIYINIIIPMTQEISKLTYSSNIIIPDNATMGEYDTVDIKKINKYILEQKKYTIEMMEDSNNKAIIEIIHFDMNTGLHQNVETNITFE
jgi:hypothetical protein